MGSKFKLSDTMQFFTGKLNAITGGEVDLLVEVDDEKVKAGEELRARAVVRSPEKNRKIDYLLISLKGQVQRDGKWQDYVQSAEVAQDNALPADHEFVVPIVIRVPRDAVLTEDGGSWSIFARAYIDKTLDPRAESAFTVLHGDG
jgi:hypothetical protein